MSVERPTKQQWAKSCAEDGEFMLAARYWDGGLRLVIGAQTLELSVRSGVPEADADLSGGVIELAAEPSVWKKILALGILGQESLRKGFGDFYITLVGFILKHTTCLGKFCFSTYVLRRSWLFCFLILNRSEKLYF